jgi:hypothetical protein
MMCLLASYMKKYDKNIFFCILKINEEKSRIRSWIPIRILIKMSRISDTAKTESRKTQHLTTSRM